VPEESENDNFVGTFVMMFDVRYYFQGNQLGKMWFCLIYQVLDSAVVWQDYLFTQENALGFCSTSWPES
jgi:hypothetical protein